MAFTISTGKTEATGTFSLINNIYTLTSISGTADNTNTTLGTVPANKKWTIINANFSAVNGAGSIKYITISANGNTIAAGEIYSGVGTGKENVSKSWIYGQAPVITAGQTIVLNNTNGAGYPAVAQIDYIEETV
ncbi:MAG: hypothetical protein HGB12_12535 [Bacteroidetes bacterium]|nr:hypothetical protein [Bacteroidota bacterium]